MDEKKTLVEKMYEEIDKEEIHTGKDEDMGHVKAEYKAEDIQILHGLDPVKLRPGMYIGTTGPQGLHHLVWEIVDNAVDEALAGRCNKITVELLDDDAVSVTDNGSGIPVDIHPETGRPAIESVFTTLHAGGKFKDGAYKVSGGLHGVGASVVNALSKWLHVYVRRDGNVYYQEYDHGYIFTDLKAIAKNETGETGSTIVFSPDPKIFQEGTTFNYETVRSRLQQLAFLNKGVTFSVQDKRTGEEKEAIEYCYEGGLREYVDFLNNSQPKLNQKIMYIEGEQAHIQIEIAMLYNTTFNPMLYCYTNNIFNPEGGTHEEAFKSTLTRLMNKYGNEHNLFKKKDESLTGDDVREGLIAVVSVKHPDPQFEGQTKTKLGSEDARRVVSNIMSQQLQRFLDENPQDAKTIIDKAITAAHARAAAKKAREEVQRKNPLDSLGLASKLVDCRSKDPTKSEVFIVEGDSAGGSAKQGRDAEYQAILPLRGKVLNVEKARMDKILANNELVTMIQAFGAGMDDNFDVSKLRYHKIVIMTDADVDGAHIRTLLLTFFYRHMKPLITEGYVYIAQPPLYRIQSNKTIHYAYSDEERNEIIKNLSTKPQIQRYKGLGEMDDTQLWETTLNPENRVLLRVNLDDAIEADQTFSCLMGEDVEPRRDFINRNAGYVKDLDY